MLSEPGPGPGRERARNYWRLESVDSRRRIRWVVAALTVALIPFSMLTFAFRLMDWVSNATYRFYGPITFLAMLLIPASIAMAVWKEQLFDIRVLVRRLLQYLFARAALRGLLALPILLLAYSIFSNPNRTVGRDRHAGIGLDQHRADWCHWDCYAIPSEAADGARSPIFPRGL